jgi:deoxyribonuclease-1
LKLVEINRKTLPVNKIHLTWLSTFSLLMILSYSPAFGKTSFSRSKTLLKNKIYPHKGRTFYCNCLFQKKSIKTKNCGVNLKKFKNRKKRLEWEHVVPAHAFGQSFKEWRNAKVLCRRKGKKALSGRKCAAKHSELFRAMEANLHNLVPTVGSVNALRSNLSFAEISKSDIPICRNGFKIKGRKVSPPKGRKGDVARIYFYMEKTYPGHGIISNKNRKLFQAWSKQDPVTPEECLVNSRKKLLQGEGNVFVEKFCP